MQWNVLWHESTSRSSWKLGVHIDCRRWSSPTFNNQTGGRGDGKYPHLFGKKIETQCEPGGNSSQMLHEPHPILIQYIIRLEGRPNSWALPRYFVQQWLAGWLHTFLKCDNQPIRGSSVLSAAEQKCNSIVQLLHHFAGYFVLTRRFNVRFWRWWRGCLLAQAIGLRSAGGLPEISTSRRS
jgi:hypothetical protein